MAKEPDNLMLKLLREIRATQDDHGVEFKRVRKTVEEWQETSATMAGFAVHANTRHESVSRELDSLKKRVQKLEKTR